MDDLSTAVGVVGSLLRDSVDVSAFGNLSGLSGSRRLQSADDSTSSGDTVPSYGQFLIVVGLVILLYFFLRGVFYIAYYWQKKAEARMEKALEQRSKVIDNFRHDNGYSWDYVFVFKVGRADEPYTDMQIDHSLRNLVLTMSEAGLQTKLFYSAQHDEVYCKIRASLKRLSEQAEMINYKLKCEPLSVANLLSRGKSTGPPEQHWGGVSIESDGIQTEIPPYEHIYASFKREFNEEDKRLYQRKDAKNIFKGSDRVKLLTYIIAAPKDKGGCGLNLSNLRKEGCILGYFPIHDEVELNQLETKWFIFWQKPSNTPVTEVRDYFGEKIGLLTAWIAHYTNWLFPAAFFGFCAWINVAAEDDDPNAILAPVYALFMSIWATLFLESWKRREMRLSLEWGTIGDDEEEVIRQEYIQSSHVVLTDNPVDGRPQLYFPNRIRRQRQMISYSLSAFFLLCVIAIFVGMFAAKFIMASSDDRNTKENADTITSVLNAVIVTIMGMIYQAVSEGLNEYENHRTSLDFEDALIGKTFIVQFINSFAALLFIAFGQPMLYHEGLGIPQCTGSCMYQLKNTLSVLFLSKLGTGSIMALMTPYINSKMRESAEFTDVDQNEISLLEREFLRDEYDLTMGPFIDYADYSMQFAYATMFISAYPMATCMAVVNNYVMMRINAWNFCHLRKRPVPQRVRDIGTWFSILEMISYAAVLCSAGLIAFTGTIAENYTWATRIWIFIIVTSVVMVIKLIVQVASPRIDDEVKIQVDRNVYILNKLFNNIPDVNDAQIQKDVKSMATVQYTIRINDDDPL